MFDEINKELEELQQAIYRCNNIDRRLRSLNQQLSEQVGRQTQLELELRKENLDVEKLSKMNITTIFYTILGSKEGQIEKERQEVLAAQLKLDDINKQISDTKKHISELKAERAKISQSEEKYNKLYKKKYDLLVQNKNDNTSRINEIEDKIVAYKSNLKEINEAISAGNRVLQSLKAVDKSLGSAEGWGLWDMLGGGGLITGMIKHGHIDDARDNASEVQRLLNRFRTELADVKVSSSITIDIEGFVKFADFFFDGLIVDWVVQSRINDSQESANKVRSDVVNVLSKLSKMQGNDNEQLSNLERELSKIIMKA
jgi:DNA repair exonuclease SbcCD ATPase subunit